MRTIKERIGEFQDNIINGVSKNGLCEDDKKKIKSIGDSVFKWSFLLFESIGMGIVFLRILPAKLGWDFAQTSLLLSILFVLTIPLFQKKQKSL